MLITKNLNFYRFFFYLNEKVTWRCKCCSKCFWFHPRKENSREEKKRCGVHALAFTTSAATRNWHFRWTLNTLFNLLSLSLSYPHALLSRVHKGAGRMCVSVPPRLDAFSAFWRATSPCDPFRHDQVSRWNAKDALTCMWKTFFESERKVVHDPSRKIVKLISHLKKKKNIEG